MKKVILGMSGGVDSAVSAVKLLEAGYEVEALFMRNWDSALNNDLLGNPDTKDDICPQERDYNDALAVSKRLGIKLHRIDFIEEYWQKVFTYFLEEYRQGRTPNPDILCNKEIKFKAFLEHALTLGADYIAMGHYARVIHKADKSYLLRGLDNNKDQSYFLAMLSQAQIRHALFPIGELEKKDVRKIASEYNLEVASKKDSTGICFIGERNFKEFLKNYIPAKSGDMRTLSGDFVMKHDGLMYYTIGQRKGLGIGGMDKYGKEPWFVIGKDVGKNILYVGQGFHNEYLYSNRCIAIMPSWISDIPKVNAVYQAKFRYRAVDTPVTIKYLDDKILEITYQGARGVTPGQAVVLYDNEYCLGGAIIDKVYMNDERRMY